MHLFDTPFVKRAILKYAFHHQSKPKSFELLEQVFIDSEGRRYFKWRDDMDIPISRRSRLSVAVMELAACLTGNELSDFIDALDVSLSSILNPANGKKDPAGLSKIGFLIEEMKFRRDNLINVEIMFKLAATLYIREDENPGIIDEGIEEEKVSQFKKDAAGGLYDFFYKSGLRQYIPFSDMSEEVFIRLLEMTKRRMIAIQEMMPHITSSPQ